MGRDQAGTESGTPGFGEDDVATFLEEGDVVVPGREAQRRIVAALIPRRREPFQVLDLGCGDGGLAEAVLERFPEVTVHGIDASATMLDAARKRLSSYGDRFQTRESNIASVGWRRSYEKVGGVVSSLAIHHLSHEQKRALFRDVHACLLPRGAFLVADLVDPATRVAREVAAEEWDRAVEARSLELTGTTAAARRFREKGWNHFRTPDPADRPASLLDQLHWLREAGFLAPDIFWMHAGHAVFGAMKGS